MKSVFFDSVGGASGNMILGALAGLGADLSAIESALKEILPQESFRFHMVPCQSYGINGLHMTVEILKDSAEERSLKEILPLIQKCKTSDRAKQLAEKTFRRLAEAEGEIHGKPPEHVHFHEVGAVDSIADILGSCMAFDQLGLAGCAFGPLPEGTGTFTCRHGCYPIPAPATLELLRGCELIRTGEPFEMITPTGAALLTSFPAGTAKGKILKTSNAFGTKKLNHRPNLLRASLLETLQPENACILLETNVDDASPEVIACAMERFLEQGASDAWTTPIFMKKGRAAVQLSVLVPAEKSSDMEALIFRETGTFGIRRFPVDRAVLDRSLTAEKTSFGLIKFKTGFLNGEQIVCKPELEDCCKTAAKVGISVREIQKLLQKEYNCKAALPKN